MSSSAETTADTTPAAAESRLAVLLFTDIVGSTELKSRLGAGGYSALLTRHDVLFKQALSGIDRAEVINDTGDGYFLCFARASDAVRFALRLQKAIHDEPWGARPLRLSIGIHTGEVTRVDDASGRPRLVGLAIDIAGRLTALAGPAQVLLTRTAFDEARQHLRDYPLPAGAAADDPANLPPLRWAAHGDYRFKGADEPIEVFEVGGDGLAPLTPPPDSDEARRSVSAAQEETLGWRPAVGLEVPSRVHWVLEAKLGEGTFGEVWLARHERTKEKRVFKFCFDLERLHSFKRELTFFRLLRDALGERRDIARLYDVRLDHPPFFLESEYAPGGNLLMWADAQGGLDKVPLATRLEVVAKVADAVAAAHSIGILHKDIKPGNILLHVDGDDGTLHPQLGDFGIGMLVDRSQLAARHITEIGFTGLETEQSSRTGTRMYAPPESLTGRPFTTQGDIYALGVLLYQMVVGDLARPLASGWERDVGDDFLREDIAGCVDGDPARRFGSASELARRLRDLPERKANRDRTRRAAAAHDQRKRLLRAAGLLAGGCMLVAAVALVGYFREHALREALRHSEGLARDREQAAQLQLLDNRLLAGDSLAQAKRYAEANNEYEEAWGLADALGQPLVRPISGLLQARGESPPPVLNRHPTTLPTEAVSPLTRVRIAPSGRFVVAGDGNGHAYVMDLPLLRRVAALPIAGWGYGIALDAQGTSCYVGSSGGQLKAWDAGQWQAPREAAEKSSLIYGLAVAPDGQTLATVHPSSAGRAGGGLTLWSARPLRRTRTVETPAGLLSVAFSPDGATLVTGDEKGRIAIRSASDARPIATLEGHTAEVTAVAFTPDGRRLVSGSMDKTVRVWDLSTRGDAVSIHRPPRRGP
jgi:class 3 adenylate cyclase